MMQRIVVLISLLIANLLMLAFAVVPHHHHVEGNICIEQKHCECEHDMDAAETAEHSHDNEEECFLKYQITEPRKSTETLSAEQTLLHPTIKLPIALLKTIFTPAVTETDREFFIEKDIPLYKSLLFSSTGLRAPPFFA